LSKEAKIIIKIFHQFLQLFVGTKMFLPFDEKYTRDIHRKVFRETKT
jgi:hypothetical protein